MLLSVTVLHHSNRLSSMTDRVSPDVEPRPPLPLLCPILAPLATQAATCTSQRKEKWRRETVGTLALPSWILCWVAHRDRRASPDSPHTKC